MTTAHAGTVTTFDGKFIRYACDAGFDFTVARLHDQVGNEPVDLVKLNQEYASVESFSLAVEKYASRSDFMLFHVFEHGAWIKRFGLAGQATRFVIGNPLIAMTMIHHDLGAGLFVPVEILIESEFPIQRCDISYVLPSSLIARGGNDRLKAAAIVLDQKLETLVRHVAGL